MIIEKEKKEKEIAKKENEKSVDKDAQKGGGRERWHFKDDNDIVRHNRPTLDKMEKKDKDKNESKSKGVGRSL